MNIWLPLAELACDWEFSRFPFHEIPARNSFCFVSRPTRFQWTSFLFVAPSMIVPSTGSQPNTEQLTKRKSFAYFCWKLIRFLVDSSVCHIFHSLTFQFRWRWCSEQRQTTMHIRQRIQNDPMTRDGTWQYECIWFDAMCSLFTLHCSGIAVH